MFSLFHVTYWAGSGGSRMGAKGGLNSEHLRLKLEIHKDLRLINTNLMNKSDLYEGSSPPPFGSASCGQGSKRM